MTSQPGPLVNPKVGDLFIYEQPGFERSLMRVTEVRSRSDYTAELATGRDWARITPQTVLPHFKPQETR